MSARRADREGPAEGERAAQVETTDLDRDVGSMAEREIIQPHEPAAIQTTAPIEHRFLLMRCRYCGGEWVFPRILRDETTGEIVFDFSLVYCPLENRSYFTGIPEPEVPR